MCLIHILFSENAPHPRMELKDSILLLIHHHIFYLYFDKKQNTISKEGKKVYFYTFSPFLEEIKAILQRFFISWWCMPQQNMT